MSETQSGTGGAVGRGGRGRRRRELRSLLDPVSGYKDECSAKCDHCHNQRRLMAMPKNLTMGFRNMVSSPMG